MKVSLLRRTSNFEFGSEVTECGDPLNEESFTIKTFQDNSFGLQNDVTIVVRKTNSIKQSGIMLYNIIPLFV
ncbi:MAG: hypothetical protein DYG83_14430 [Candidatus Brocadia sp. AMX2]|uniref:Uncharacterized protein n=1 Tax=Candidatus Brocadia sinica JPN1 TaxID=1197129 RepID=A0ABQ0JYS7_9BACT|nr:hypothetical protein [Candidatus Brocadia sp. AMX2]KXK24823.1 MAG: hypothetical protein UZ01_03685 [Candidatus Brocadia sinica]MBC6933599.1 hypothetical protein [Candidatus Brocadia sp.]MBL1170451.1 hypothetical protein [Candidatus Brocadia sp. AMX1]NOG40317.1 hypothetical protein [Planctomycetota bacterium]GAN33841.1 hypothetical protein BROSI_A2375 [Candidatus Brocadia sinica JPN1]